MKYTLALVTGGVAGGVCAVVGAIVALIVAATSDFTGITLILSAAGILASLPVVFMIGAVLGAAIGYFIARVGR